MRVLLALRVYSSIIMYPAQNRFYFLINRFIWDCILLVLPNKAVNFLFAQNLRHWVPLWFIDNTSDSGVLYWFVQRLINLPNGYEGNEKKVLFWSFSIRTSIFLGNILLVLLDWNCQNEYHHDQVTLHWAQRDAINFWFSSTCSIISFERILYLFSGVVKFTHQSFFFAKSIATKTKSKKYFASSLRRSGFDKLSQSQNSTCFVLVNYMYADP